MSKKQRSFFDRYLLWTLSGVFVGLILIFSSWAVDHYYQTHFLPRTSVGTLDLSNLTLEEAITAADQIWSFSPGATLTVVAGDTPYTASVTDLGFQFETKDTLEQLFAAQHHLTFLQTWQYLLSGQSLYLDSINLDSDYERLLDFLTSIDTEITQPGRHPAVSIDADYITIDPGQQQISLDWEQTLSLIRREFPAESSFSAVLHISDEFTPLTTAQVSLLQTQASSLLGKSLLLTTDSINNYSTTLDDVDLIPLLLPDNPSRTSYAHALFTDIDAVVSRQPQEPVLNIDPATGAVLEFTPPRDGLTLSEPDFLVLLDNAITGLTTTDATSLQLTLPLVITPPTHSLAEVNDYGIAEVIGFGESYYAHSTAGRVHNVAVAASRVNNTLVAPGEEFSFNRAVGDVSAASGYQPGYIIQGGRSVLSAGGGVCQVSTTVFRALLDAGLQITLRKPHSYRVTYYELNNDPGFDATVYTGNVDLRFINDTDRYVLITATTDSDNLYMYVEIWGTSDGRYTEISNYTKFNAVAAPAPQYIEDPSLAPGQIKQIDWAVGGLQTNFTHTIYNADGSVRSQKDYPSKYQAWSAKYLVGPSQ